jgi:hypothetical protein
MRSSHRQRKPVNTMASAFRGRQTPRGGVRCLWDPGHRTGRRAPGTLRARTAQRSCNAPPVPSPQCRVDTLPRGALGPPRAAGDRRRVPGAAHTPCQKQERAPAILWGVRDVGGRPCRAAHTLRTGADSSSFNRRHPARAGVCSAARICDQMNAWRHCRFASAHRGAQAALGERAMSTSKVEPWSGMIRVFAPSA